MNELSAYLVETRAIIYVLWGLVLVGFSAVVNLILNYVVIKIKNRELEVKLKNYRRSNERLRAQVSLLTIKCDQLALKSQTQAPQLIANTR